MAKRYKATPVPPPNAAQPICEFTAVSIVCGRFSWLRRLSHVSDTINFFLDQLVFRKWTLESTTAQGLVHLLDFLADQEWTEAPRSFREQRFDYNIRCAASNGYPAVLDWLTTKYMLEREDTVHEKIFKLAFNSKHVNVLQWLHETRKISSDVLQQGVELTYESLGFARWLHGHIIGVKLKLSVAYCAKKYGNIEVIKWAHAHEDQYLVTGITKAMDECAILGRLEDLFGFM